FEHELDPQALVLDGREIPYLGIVAPEVEQNRSWFRCHLQFAFGRVTFFAHNVHLLIIKQEQRFSHTLLYFGPDGIKKLLVENLTKKLEGPDRLFIISFNDVTLLDLLQYLNQFKIGLI